MSKIELVLYAQCFIEIIMQLTCGPGGPEGPFGPRGPGVPCIKIIAEALNIQLYTILFLA